MGIYSDLAASLNGPVPRVGDERASGEQLRSKAAFADPDVGSAFAARDEQTVIPQQTDSGPGDTYTLTFEFFGALKGITATTAPIAYDDTVLIPPAVNAALAAVVPGWTNGDVSISTIGLNAGTLTLDFDGASVAGTPCIVTLTAIGFTPTLPITRTAGQTDRKALEALYTLNVVEGPIHDSPDAPNWTRPASNGQSRPRADLIRKLALEAGAEDGTDEVPNAVAKLYPKA